MSNDAPGTWFFSPPVGPSIDPASASDVLAALKQDDGFWSTEAPATEEDYCRENWAPLAFSAPGQNATLRAALFYVDQGLFTVALSGERITRYPKELTEEERAICPSAWFDLYPVVNDHWDEFLEVRRQGNLFRYPQAVLVNRDQLAAIVTRLFESQDLDPSFEWMMQMDYVKRFGRWFFVEE